MTDMMELSKVKQILDLLDIQGNAKEGDQKRVLDYVGKNGGFAGQATIAISEDPQQPKLRNKAGKEIMVTDGMVQEALEAQVLLKAAAAKADLAAIAASVDDKEKKKPEAPKWLKANWGNNGVNPAIGESTVVDAASATANIAQNMVMVVSENPEVAKDEKVIAGVEAAAKLTSGLVGKNGAGLDGKETENLVTQVQDGLRQVVEKSGVTPMDKNSKKIDLEEYITERTKEIKAGIEQRLRAQGAAASVGLGILPKESENNQSTEQPNQAKSPKKRSR